MIDLSQSVKTKVLAALDAALPPLVPSARIFPRQVATLPALPFVRYEGDARPYENTCGRGVEAFVRLHVFADGEVQCESICAAIVTAIDALSDVQSAQWQSAQYLPRDESSEWHGVVDFRIVTTT